MENQAPTAADEQLHRLAKIMANPSSAPVLAKMVSSRQRQGTRIVSERLMRVNNSSCNRTNARTAVTTSKYADVTALWMNRQTLNESDEEEEEYYVAETYRNQVAGHELIQNRMDLQTNNSKKEGVSPDSRYGRPGEGNESLDDDASSELSDGTSPENASAVAKGADAMVKMSLSRQTEIIDTSKLVEEGKVETEYEEAPEEIEEQDRAMIDDYEKTFAYARRLRALLNMQFKELDRGTIETNFLLIKAHEHPTQKMIDRWRNVDLGHTYNDQVKRQKQIDDFKTSALKKKGKKDQEARPIYPEMIRFTVRFRKAESEKRWKDYLSYRQKQKKLGGPKNSGPVPKQNDKYVFAFLDVWSYNVVVFVKPSATVREIIDPVFARLGLERRADFSYTIGCFKNDKRAGKAKVLGVPTLPEPVEMYELASDLYKKNCTEIYVNDNRCEMFFIFPDYYERNMIKKPGQEQPTPDPKGKKGKGKDNKNKKDGEKKGNDKESNTQSPADQTSQSGPDNSAGKGASKNNASESDNWLNVNKSNAAACDDDAQNLPTNVETLSVPSASVRTSAVAAPATTASAAHIGATASPGMLSPGGSGISPPAGLRTTALLRDETAAFEESAVTSGDSRGRWQQSTA